MNNLPPGTKKGDILFSIGVAEEQGAAMAMPRKLEKMDILFMEELLNLPAIEDVDAFQDMMNKILKTKESNVDSSRN